MGQGDIIELLKKEGRKMTTKEIAKSCNVGISCTHVKLKKYLVPSFIISTSPNSLNFFNLKK